MNKKRAKFNFFLTSVLLILALFFCFAQFNLPDLNTYNGLFNSISASSEISSGYSAVYEITTDNASNEEVKDTIEQIRNILDSQGFTGSKVYRQGDCIKAEVESASNASSILNILGDSMTFYISSIGKDQTTITEEELSIYDLVGTDVKNAYSTTTVNMNKEYHGITIEFTADGAKKLQELTKQVSATENKYVYFYFDGNKSTSLEVSETTNGILSFYSESYTEDTAQEYALQILMSSTGVSLKTISNSTTTATLGNNVLLYTMIAIAVILLITLVVLPVLYGQLGLVADLSVLFGAVFNIFLLQALPLTTGSIATIFGSLLGMGLLVLCHVIYLNRIKSEFKYLNKLQLSVKTGFKKSWLINLDLCAVVFLGAISMVFWKIPFVSTFAIGLSVGAFVALFNTIILMKDFVTWYVYINPKDYKKVKFTKGENNE